MKKNYAFWGAQNSELLVFLDPVQKYINIQGEYLFVEWKSFDCVR